jgi:uncharacterized repeat protein (TIGR01451 family)
MSKWIPLVSLALLVALFWFIAPSHASPSHAFGITPTPTSPPEPTPTPPPNVTPTPGAPTKDDDDVEQVDPVITKRGGPSEAVPGEEVTFYIEVTNRGRNAAVDVVVTDDVPQYLEILEVTTTQGTVTIAGQRVTVQVGTVGPDYVVEIVIRTRVRLDAPVPIVMENVAVLKSPNGGERITPPVIINVSAPNLPETGGIKRGTNAIAWIGGGILVLGMMVVGIERARHKTP